MQQVLTGHKQRIEGRKLYHSSVYIPEIIQNRLALAKKYLLAQNIKITEHARKQIGTKGLDTPSYEDISRGKIFEIEVEGHNIAKVCIRATYQNYDLCFAIRLNGIVLTVWGRNKNDQEQTLDKSRYIHNKAGENKI